MVTQGAAQTNSLTVAVGTENEVHARNVLFAKIAVQRRVRQRAPQHDFRLANVQKLVTKLVDNHDRVTKERFMWSQDAM